MLYRPLRDPPAPEPDEPETPEMIEAAAVVAGGEEDLAMLSRLARIGMELAEAQGVYALERLGKSEALSPGEDPTAAFNRLAQTVRRIIALKTKLRDDLEKRRAGLAVDRAAHRARRAKDHAAAVKEEIDVALAEAFHADLDLPPFDPKADQFKPEPYEIERREMLCEAERLLDDLDDLKGWLDRPIGETVAKLCQALGLPADACVRQGDTWLIKRPPTEYEEILKEKTKSLPPLHGEGGFEQSEKTGGEWRSANDSG